MEKEELEFSVVRPILFLIVAPAVYSFFLYNMHWNTLMQNWPTLLTIVVMILITFNGLRITALMLLRKPAVVLTNKSITVTIKSYSVNWEDVMDVYLASGSKEPAVRAPKVRYVIIKVREPEKCIKAIKNPFIRYYQWFTRGWRVSPFEVNLFLVKWDDYDNYELILKYYQRNRLYFRIP